MLVKQMHIEFNLGFQKLGANSRRKFYDEEIDILLNKAQDEFIADQVKETSDNRGFMQIQVDADKIRPLIVRNSLRVAEYKDLDTNWRKYAVDLPGDYAHLISDQWYLGKKCSTNTSTTSDKHIAVIGVKESTKPAKPFYETFTLAETSLNLALTTTIPNSLYTGFSSKPELYRAVELLIETFYEMKRKSNTALAIVNDYDLYWEKGAGYNYPGSLILVRDNASALTLTSDTDSLAGTNLSVPGGTAPTKTVEAAVSYHRYPSRVVKASYIDQLLSTPFYKPLKNSPLATLTGSQIEVYSHPSYIVNKASLTYVRRAARISLSLQRNCELAADFHQQIVDRAVALAAGRTEQAGLYQAQTMENEKNK